MRWDKRLERRNPDLLRGCVKTVCAFLNGIGGTLLVGVADSGELNGLEDDIKDFSDRKTTDGFESRLREALVNGIDPESSHLVTVSFPIVRGVQICRVDVATISPACLPSRQEYRAVLHTGGRRSAAAGQVPLVRRADSSARILRTQRERFTAIGCPEGARVHQRTLGLTCRARSRGSSSTTAVAPAARAGSACPADAGYSKPSTTVNRAGSASTRTAESSVRKP